MSLRHFNAERKEKTCSKRLEQQLPNNDMFTAGERQRPLAALVITVLVSQTHCDIVIL